jgi:hypothetical protein
MRPEQRIVAGIRLADALQAFSESVNQPGTIFSRDHWLMPKLERLCKLLNDPVTPDQALALVDVLYQRRWMRDLIEWLDEAPEVPWAEFFEWRTRREMVRSVEFSEQFGASWPVRLEDEGLKVNKCPRCGSPNYIPIMYGLPNDDGLKAAQRGEIALGGCSLDLDGPRWFARGADSVGGSTR